MKTQVYFTLAELVKMWLEKHPQDINSYSLVVDAVAGYVKTEKGYVWGAEYFGTKKVAS